MYAESDLLPLSGLQHLAYCERQWALIHLERFWAENRLTVEGRQLHERADEPGGKSRRDLRIVRGLPIHSLRLGLSGRADVVEFHRETGTPDMPQAEPRAEATDQVGPQLDDIHGQTSLPTQPSDAERADVSLVPRSRLAFGSDSEWRAFPVEYKRGKPKSGNCDRVQLCAQALCLEEMLGGPIPDGALFYGQPRRRKEVVFTDALRAETEKLAARMHELFRDRITPRVRYNRKRCDRCSLYDRCLPKTTGRSRSVDAYLAEAMVQEEETP